MQFVSVTTQVSLSTSFHKKGEKKSKEKLHLSRERTALTFSIILLNENFIEEKDYKSMYGKKSLAFVLVLCSAYTRHLYSLAAAFQKFAPKPAKRGCQDPVFHRPVRVRPYWNERFLNVRIDLSDLFPCAHFSTG